MKETHETNLKFSKGKKKEASVALAYPPPPRPGMLASGDRNKRSQRSQMTM